jgi:hypothetical protein
VRLIDQYKHIKRRSDFYPAVDDAIARTFALLGQAPNDPTLSSILTQLEYIKRITAGGREPTYDERTSTRIGVRLLRAFEPAQTDEIEAWINVCSEVEGYFRDWLDDATFQTIDEDDLPEFF